MKSYRYRTKKFYKIKRKKSLLKNKFFWLFILSFIILLSGIYLLIFSLYFQIADIKVLGNEKVSKDLLVEIIDRNCLKRIGPFTSRSIFLINSKHIEKLISETFIDISSAKLKREFPNLLVLEVEERDRVLVLCKESCFNVDIEGIAFEEVLNYEGYKVILEKEPIIKEKIIKDSDLKTLLEIDRYFKETLNIKIKEITANFSQKYLAVRTSDNWEAYFNISKDISESLFDLNIVLNQHLDSIKRANLEYIDLRFSNNRIFYKEKTN
ncbi:MAG: FtsQ-type POTRA domain-containing protein [Candidatus Pacebacteria bacterium]|nr:FtsQ-type POTRA domain-containing protein [Candidatus Paceibacterota bacterium]